MSMSPEECDQRVLEQYHTSLNIYWGALLTINGLLFSLFSVGSIKSSESITFLNYLLIILCSASMCLIIYNFRVIKRNYYELGKTTTEDMPQVPEHLIKTNATSEELDQLIDEHTADWQEARLVKAERSYKITKLRESLIEILMVVEIVLVLAILFIPQSSISNNNSKEEKTNLSINVNDTLENSSIIGTPDSLDIEVDYLLKSQDSTNMKKDMEIR